MEGLIGECLDELRETFRRKKTRSGEWRRTQLRAILRLLEEEEEEIFAVLKEDLGKSKVEAFKDEIGVLKKSVKNSLCCLDKWMARKSVHVPLALQPAKGEVVPEPLGLVLIFGSWNFPILLSLEPLIGAIAAGNVVVVKPSELAPACATFLASAVSMYLDGSAVKVIQGGEAVGQQLLMFKWDHIFFTGSTRIGRIVMTAAAKHLTPVTLELGGKCPAILDHFKSTGDQEVAIKRIVNAKWALAGGQACVGVDYLLVQEEHGRAVVELINETLKKCYGGNPGETTGSSTGIVNAHHFQRLKKLLEEPKVADSIVHGGQTNEDSLYMEPTILLNPPLDSNIMTEEIFGPFLPVITLKKIEESIEFISSRPKPLAIYAFTSNEELKERLLSETSSGSIVFNDAVVQFLVDGLPFGGVGESGFGKYHGKFSFDTFSHERSVLRRGFLVDFSHRYPPWNDAKLQFFRRVYDFDYLGLLLVLLGLK